MRKNTLGDLFKSMITGLADFIRSLVRIFVRLIVYTGLWLPGLYALLGVALAYGASFKPFDFGTYSVLYLSGGVACIICAVIITVRNFFGFVSDKTKESISLRRRRKNEQDALDAQKREEYLREKEEEQRYAPKANVMPKEDEIPVFDEEKEAEEKKKQLPPYLIDEDWLDETAAEGEEWRPVKESVSAAPKVVATPKAELVDVYISKLYPNVLVREYTDRFELYKMYKDSQLTHIGTEYKTKK